MWWFFLKKHPKTQSLQNSWIEDSLGKDKALLSSRALKCLFMVILSLMCSVLCVAWVLERQRTLRQQGLS